jgi:Cu(I)/Ag(I) efflux system protein CusF
MRKIAFAFAGMLALATGMSGAALGQTADGQVTKIDTKQNKITLRHGPIKHLDMDEPMTMVFRVNDPAMLKQVKVGDKVKFDADKINGQFTVTKIEKAK